MVSVAPQHMAERVQKGQPCRHDHQSHNKCRHKAGGGHLGRLVELLGSQLAGHVVARAVAEKEAEGLNHGHHGKRDAHGPCGAGPHLAHEKRVRHVVEGGDQHADNRRPCQLTDQMWNRLLGHMDKFFFLCLRRSHKKTPLGLSTAPASP